MASGVRRYMSKARARIGVLRLRMDAAGKRSSPAAVTGGSESHQFRNSLHVDKLGDLLHGEIDFAGEQHVGSMRSRHRRVLGFWLHRESQQCRTDVSSCSNCTPLALAARPVRNNRSHWCSQHQSA